MGRAVQQRRTAASQEIGVLVYSGLFLADDGDMVRLLADKARAASG
ncbi:hypothetical protein ACIBO2_20660 [Nonomuraea sp. NPDC050022]